MFQYLPDGMTALALAISIGLGFIVGKQLASFVSKTTYLTLIIQGIISLIIYHVILPYIGYIYGAVTGITPSTTRPSVSVNPNISLFTSNSVSIPTSGKPVVSSTQTTLTPYGGLSCLMSINTSVSNPDAINTAYDFAPLVTLNSVKTNSPIFKLTYMPAGNLLQLLTYPSTITDTIDIPIVDDDTATRVTLGTPPIRKSFSLFVKLRPSTNGLVSIEIYINGLLGKTTTIPSHFFASGGGMVVPVIGYNAESVYPVVDAEIKSLMIWNNAESLSLRDIQNISNQPMAASGESRYMDTTECQSKNQS